MVLCSAKIYIHNITTATNNFIFNVGFLTEFITVFTMISSVSPSTDEPLEIYFDFMNCQMEKELNHSPELADFLFEISDDPDIKLELFNCSPNSYC